MNGGRAKELRQATSAAVREVQPAVAKVAEYARSVEGRVEQLGFSVQRHRAEIDNCERSISRAHAILARGLWGRVKWLITGR